MRELFHPNLEQICLSTVLNALGDPTRLQIIKNLAHKNETTCASCNIDLPKSALSHHFKVLRESGLINVRIEGKQRFLSIRFEELEQKFPGLLDSVIKSI
ncbi:MAG: putative transcriptional regulator [Eubacterium sp.]|nr:putative transcriptional regulator [Eubacterium sp.]